MRYGRPCEGPGNWKCLKCAGHQYGAAKGATAVLGVRGRRRWLARRTSAFHCISRYVKMTLERDVLRGGRTFPPEIALIPDMVDEAPAGRADAGGTRESGPQRLPAAPYMLFVGAIHRNKGVDTLLSAYVRKAEDTLVHYHADAQINGLDFDRHAEEQAVATFVRSIRAAARTFQEDPLGAPLIPNWNRVQSALPGFLEELNEVVSSDNNERE